MIEFEIRTDLALEAKEGIKDKINGVTVKEEFDEDTQIKTTKVKVLNENGKKVLSKSIGTYITLESMKLKEQDQNYHREMSLKLANEIKQLIGKKEGMTIMVIGLGNREVTADALGPMVIDNLDINRHLIIEYKDDLYKECNPYKICAIAPGVMAQTGIETSKIVKSLANDIGVDALIVVDALAARSTYRVNTTIQISDTGINPGSGVGNYRMAINKESIGIPVIAIGVPTVVDAATIVWDSMKSVLGEDGDSEDLLKNVISKDLKTMYVTPKNVDEAVKMLSFTISEAVNIAFA